jgi:hypothetical protein
LKTFEGITLLYAGNPEAIAVLEQAKADLIRFMQETPGDSGLISGYCLTVGALKDRKAVVTYCDEAIKLIPNDAFDRSLNLRAMAQGFALGGEHERALDLIDDVLSSRVGPSVIEIAADPAFNDLHESKRWQTLMNEHGLQK